MLKFYKLHVCLYQIFVLSLQAVQLTSAFAFGNWIWDETKDVQGIHCWSSVRWSPRSFESFDSRTTDVFFLCSLQILSHGVETCQGQFNTVRYMLFTDNSWSVIIYARIQLITFTLKQPVTPVMEIWFWSKTPVNSRQLEMVVFVRYAVYSEGVMLKQLRTNCRGCIYFSKSWVASKYTKYVRFTRSLMC